MIVIPSLLSIIVLTVVVLKPLPETNGDAAAQIGNLMYVARRTLFAIVFLAVLWTGYFYLT